MPDRTRADSAADFGAAEAALGSPDPRRREYGVARLAGLGDRRVAEALVRVACTDDGEVKTDYGLVDDTTTVAEIAAYALRGWFQRHGCTDADRATLLRFAADSAVAPTHVAALFDITARFTDILVPGLFESADGRLRAIALATRRGRALRPAPSFLTDPDPLVRTVAVRSLPSGRDAATARLVAALLDDPAVEVRLAVMEDFALRRELAPLLQQLERETDPGARRGLGRWLLSRGDHAVVERLLVLPVDDPAREGLLHHHDSAVRRLAYERLGEELEEALARGDSTHVEACPPEHYLASLGVVLMRHPSAAARNFVLDLARRARFDGAFDDVLAMDPIPESDERSLDELGERLDAAATAVDPDRLHASDELYALRALRHLAATMRDPRNAMAAARAALERAAGAFTAEDFRDGARLRAEWRSERVRAERAAQLAALRTARGVA